MPRDVAADNATLGAVLELARAGQHGQAATQAEAALADGLEHPLLLNVAALNLEQRGDLSGAEALLQRAVTIGPKDPGARNAYGLCLMRLERPAEAIMQFDALLTLDESLPFAHTNLGNAFLALSMVAEAESSYRCALELDTNQGGALIGLARLANSRGAFGDARMWAERALAMLPGVPDAELCMARAELGNGNGPAAEARLRQLLADTRLEPLQRAHSNGLLGDVLDAKNYTDDAFAAYTACNQELQRFYASRFTGGSNALTFLRSVNDYFDGARPEWRRKAPPDVRRSGAAVHVFVLGFPRSGTTLLEIVLEGHPDVVSLEENESLIEAVREFMGGPEDLARFAAASAATLERLREVYWRHVAASGVEVRGKVFVDKNPLNSLKLPLIGRLFPDAKIIFACRDPRDVVLSCFRHRLQMSAPIYELLSLEGAARYYDAVMHLIVRLANVAQLDMCLVRHEDVVTEFAREMKRLCAFLGLGWDPAMGDFALRSQRREVLTPSVAQLAKGLNTEGLGQWHRYRSHIVGALPVLKPWLERFLYEASSDPAARTSS
jgi:tetratricopeptide (TPR) repeat protein